jgi:redox-sensitive bicupin YhaK (pirin superfamily)
MFPLLDAHGPNPLELFQIWLNLPAADKFSTPHFSMLWADTIPQLIARDDAGLTTEVTLVAGQLGDLRPPQPPPSSWASHADADVAIWTIKMAPHATWTLPRAKADSNRTLYFFRGQSLQIVGTPVQSSAAIDLHAEQDALLINGPAESELLLLQGRPIAEPVAQYGPFVMNTQEQVQQAFEDYRRTQFGGWHWHAAGPVHAREETRFARRPDDKIERPEL